MGLPECDKNPMAQSSRQMYTSPNHPPCTPHRSQTHLIKPLGSPFQSPPSRCIPQRNLPLSIPQPQIQSHPSKAQTCLTNIAPLPTCVPSTTPIGNSSTLSPTVSRFNDNCQSTLDQIRADIDALHAHYQDIIRKGQAETARARALARTLKAERDTAREMVFKFMDDQRNSKKPSLQETEKGGQESRRKRKRACLTTETFSLLQEEETKVAIERKVPGDTVDGQETRLNVDTSPPPKKFKLQKRIWTPSGCGDRPLASVDGIKEPSGVGDSWL